MSGKGKGGRAEASPSKRPRTTADDDDFLTTFQKSSRLAYIGKWDEVWAEVLDARAELDAAPAKPSPPSPGRSRVVFHVDLDCFFASVVVRDRPELQGRPVAVCWGAPSGGGGGSSEISSCTYRGRAATLPVGPNFAMHFKRTAPVCRR